MKTMIKIIAMAIFCILLAGVYEARADEQSAYTHESNKKIVVEIDYGTMRQTRIAEVPSGQGKTALEVLQTVATVETHPAANMSLLLPSMGLRVRGGKRPGIIR